MLSKLFNLTNEGVKLHKSVLQSFQIKLGKNPCKFESFYLIWNFALRTGSVYKSILILVIFNQGCTTCLVRNAKFQIKLEKTRFKFEGFFIWFEILRYGLVRTGSVGRSILILVIFNQRYTTCPFRNAIFPIKLEKTLANFESFLSNLKFCVTDWISW